MRILLIEDNPDDARRVRELLSEANGGAVELEHEETLRSGLERLEKEQFDVLLLDLTLPDGRGFETVQKVRPVEHKLPVVVLTDIEDEETIQKTLKSGAEDYLIKGKVTAESLGRSVRYALERHVAREDLLRKSERHYRLLFDNAAEAIVVHDSELVLTDVNRIACLLVGYTREELVGKNIVDLGILHPDEMKKAANTLRRHLNGEAITEAEYRFTRKDGAERLATVTTASIRDPDGALQSITTIIHDVTEERRMVEELGKSEERFREFADCLPEVVFEVDSLGNFVYVNSNALEAFGYTEEELYSDPLNVLDMLSEEYREQAVQRMQLILSKGAQGSREYVARRKDGSTFPVIISTLPIIKDEMAVGLRGVLTDITTQKEAEETLRQTSEYLESLLDYANAPIIVWDNEFKVQRFNHAFERLAGYEADEVINTKLSLLFPVETREESLGKIESTLSGERWESVEIPILKKDGSMRVALWNSANIYDKDGKTIIATIAQGQDITERKEAEEALGKSEEKYRTLFESSRDALMALAPPSWAFTSCNTAALEMFGARDEREFISLTPWNVSPDFQPDGRASADKAREMIDTALRDGSFLFEWTHRRLRGEEFPATVLLTRVDIGGEIVVQATVRDVTEPKTTREKLHELAERYKTVADFTYDWEWWLGPDGRYLYVSPSCERITGHSPDEFMNEPGLLFHIVHPQDREAVREHLVESYYSTDTHQTDFRIVLPDGRIRWIGHWCQQVLDADGKVLGTRASNRDITNLKVAEEKIKGLALRLLEEGERVRARIAADLHDDVGQSLNAIKLVLDMQRTKVKGRSMTNEMGHSIASISDMVSEVIGKVRAVSVELVPVELVDFGLDSALNNYLVSFANENRTSFEFKTNGTPRRAGLLVETSLFRIAQEALNNIRKHSEASRVVISTFWSESLVSLSVYDDGTGFDTERAFEESRAGEHFGLVAMRERARILEGEFTVESEPGAGTTVTASVPLERS